MLTGHAPSVFQRFQQASWNRLIGTPQSMFEREWKEEVRQLRGKWRNPFPAKFDRSNQGAGPAGWSKEEKAESQNIVIARWQERGIWLSSWGHPWPEQNDVRT
jgi:hypothetical protein